MVSRLLMRHFYLLFYLGNRRVTDSKGTYVTALDFVVKNTQNAYAHTTNLQSIIKLWIKANVYRMSVNRSRKEAIALLLIDGRSPKLIHHAVAGYLFDTNVVTWKLLPVISTERRQTSFSPSTVITRYWPNWTPLNPITIISNCSTGEMPTSTYDVNF